MRLVLLSLVTALGCGGPIAPPPATSADAPSGSGEASAPRARWDLEVAGEGRFVLALFPCDQDLGLVYSTGGSSPGVRVACRDGDGRWARRDQREGTVTSAERVRGDGSESWLVGAVWGATGDALGLTTLHANGTLGDARALPVGAWLDGTERAFRGADGHLHACLRARIDERGGASTGSLRHATDEGGEWTTEDLSNEAYECAFADDPDGGVAWGVVEPGALVVHRTGHADLRVPVEGHAAIGFDAAGALTAIAVDEAGITWIHGGSRDRLDAPLQAARGRFATVFATDGTPRVLYASAAGGLRYATGTAEGWQVEDVFDGAVGPTAVSLALDAQGRPAVAFAQDRWSVVARRVEAPCAAGQQLVDEVCCWPGQTRTASGCEGAPSCPATYYPTADGCAPFSAVDRWALARCPERRLHDEDREPYAACVALTESEAPVREPLARACEAGDGARCFALAEVLGSPLLDYRVVLSARCPAGRCIARHAEVSRGQGGDPAAMRAPHERGCALGHGDACLALALASEPAEALPLFADRCRAGDPSACAWVAFERRASPDDPRVPEALAQLEAVCDAGDAAACVDLGVLRLRGVGAAPDPRAAAQRFAAPCGVVERSEEPLDDDELPPAAGPAYDPLEPHDPRVRACVQLAAVADHHPAAVNRATWRDSAAPTILTEACDEGVTVACDALASMYRGGHGVRRDRARATALREQACEANDPGGPDALEGCPTDR
ncbi:MAG: hypothetical protein H6719_29975 [Sandaracinaceae bacterium]|nr:hypothetical protein [Sandaracinaceae bacterium]